MTGAVRSGDLDGVAGAEAALDAGDADGQQRGRAAFQRAGGTGVDQQTPPHLRGVLEPGHPTRGLGAAGREPGAHLSSGQRRRGGRGIGEDDGDARAGGDLGGLELGDMPPVPTAEPVRDVSTTSASRSSTWVMRSLPGSEGWAV